MRSLFAAALVLPACSIGRAEEPSAKTIAYHGYPQAIELKQGSARAVLCPQAGGRVLEFSVD
ncbi:MAG TPA: hypothetical protein VGI99_07645, partial [Gemmataceae bacterium]